MEKVDTETGEILGADEAGGEDARNLKTADGGAQPKRSGYIADVIRMLDEGQFNADASEDMRDLVSYLEAHAHNNKGSAKGKLVITLDFVIGNNVMAVVPTHAVKKPIAKRAATVLFSAENGSLGLNPPSQMAMFGGKKVRDNYIAGPGEETRDV